MVDELMQESFQTGKAIVTVSVDLITAIADACKRSEQQNPSMSEEQKETLLGKVVDKVMSNYKETHGSLKGFNREGKDVTHAITTTVSDRHILIDIGGSRSERHFQTNSKRKWNNRKSSKRGNEVCHSGSNEKC